MEIAAYRIASTTNATVTCHTGVRSTRSPTARSATAGAAVISDGSVVGGSEGDRPVARGLHGRDERCPHLVVLELADGRGGGAAGLGHLLAEHGRWGTGLAEQLGRADHGLHDERGRGAGRQAEVYA